MTERESQERKIRIYMEDGNSITGMEAFEMFRCTRLPARVADMKSAGVPVRSDWEYELDTNGKVVSKWKRYWIARQ